MREGINYERKKEGEAQSLQPPFHTLTAIVKIRLIYLIAKQLRSFRTGKEGNKAIDYSLTPTKTISLIDIYEHVKLDSGQG